MGLSGLDFMTVAANFLDSYSRTRRADLDFKRDAGRQDQLISAERQYQSGVREGERAFQSQQAQGARDFQRSESDREYARGATGRALQEQKARMELGMTQAQFDEWKATAPGRAHMADLEGRKAEAELGLIGAQTQHYRTMGSGGGGGGRAPNPNAVTPDERNDERYNKTLQSVFKMIARKDPDTGEYLDLDGDLDRAAGIASKMLGRADQMKVVDDGPPKPGPMDKEIVTPPREAANDPVAVSGILKVLRQRAGAEADSAYRSQSGIPQNDRGTIHSINRENDYNRRLRGYKEKARLVEVRRPNPNYLGNLPPAQQDSLLFGK